MPKKKGSLKYSSSRVQVDLADYLKSCSSPYLIALQVN